MNTVFAGDVVTPEAALRYWAHSQQPTQPAFVMGMELCVQRPSAAILEAGVRASQWPPNLAHLVIP